MSHNNLCKYCWKEYNSHSFYGNCMIDNKYTISNEVYEPMDNLEFLEYKSWIKEGQGDKNGH